MPSAQVITPSTGFLLASILHVVLSLGRGQLTKSVDNQIGYAITRRRPTYIARPVIVFFADCINYEYTSNLDGRPGRDSVADAPGQLQYLA